MAYRWCALALRAVALAVAAWVVLTGWQPLLQVLTTHEVRIELRPQAPFRTPLQPRWV